MEQNNDSKGKVACLESLEGITNKSEVAKKKADTIQWKREEWMPFFVCNLDVML